MAETLKDFPPGPLDFYRKKASFDWKKLKLFLFEEEEIRYHHNVHQILQKYPEFQPVTTPLSFDEVRHLSFNQNAIIRANEDKIINLKYGRFLEFTQDATIKYGLTIKLFTATLDNLGGERHKKFIEASEQGKISGCFALTEVGHGSNVKGMRTTATYDRETKQFIIHSPDFQAAKCWIGGLGTSATHALLYAQLYLDGKSYGLHTFVVPLRDPETLIPYPGVTVGDMGEKMGLNGIDNGFVLFNNYHIPRENLLNKNGDVTEDGQYVSPIKDDNKRFGATLLALSMSRVGVFAVTEIAAGHALTIAVRYAGVRRQFGPDDKEIPILEYPTHQYRLLPYLATEFVLKNFSRYLVTISNSYLQSRRDANQDLELFGIEFHIITSAAKPVSSWVSRDAIQSSREACAGHGYLKAAGLGRIKQDQDASLTYEGENWVLIQQTSNFLLKIWPSVLNGVEISSPLKSLNFLTHAKEILNTKFGPKSIKELYNPESILKIYQWLICYLLKQTYDRQQELLNKGMSKFDAKNNSQVFHGKKLGVAYIEHFFHQIFLEKIYTCTDATLKSILLNLFLLSGLYSLDKFTNLLYQGGYATGEKPGILIQDAITDLCNKLKNEAVSLVDAVAPPDFILNSILGASDGQVYERIQHSFLSSPYGTGRPKWWRDIVHWRETSKL